MSDPRGFLKFERVEAKYRPVQERLRDFREVSVALPEPVVRTQAQRCMDCGVAFCQSGCPLGNRIPEWNELGSQSQWAEALERLHATNNFPEFTSRLCPAPCESACVLDLQGQPVTIKSVERQVIERGFELGLIRPQPATRKTGRRVAIIGSGPAGLAAAQELVRKGHEVTVFEKHEKPGGLLRYGIPDFKMEKSVIDRRLEQLTAEGVRFQTNVSLGKDLKLAQLLLRFDAVGLAVGAEQPRDLKIPGRELGGIHFAMDYLIDQNETVSQVRSTSQITAKDKTVIVIGGGDTGSDCLGTARRQGAREVFQFEILPQPPLTRSEQTPWPKWPLLLRSSHAHEEGALREWSLSTKAFLGNSRRQVTGLVTEQVRSVNGVFQSVPGTEREFKADLVVLALGFLTPALKTLMSPALVATNERGLVQTDRHLMTSVPGIFTAGDARRGPSLIVWAIAEGRKMAAGIERYLSDFRQA